MVAGISCVHTTSAARQLCVCIRGHRLIRSSCHATCRSALLVNLMKQASSIALLSCASLWAHNERQDTVFQPCSSTLQDLHKRQQLVKWVTIIAYRKYGIEKVQHSPVRWMAFPENDTHYGNASDAMSMRDCKKWVDDQIAWEEAHSVRCDLHDIHGCHMCDSSQ